MANLFHCASCSVLPASRCLFSQRCDNFQKKIFRSTCSGRNNTSHSLAKKNDGTITKSENILAISLFTIWVYLHGRRHVILCNIHLYDRLLSHHYHDMDSRRRLGQFLILFSLAVNFNSSIFFLWPTTEDSVRSSQQSQTCNPTHMSIS